MKRLVVLAAIALAACSSSKNTSSSSGSSTTGSSSGTTGTGTTTTSSSGTSTTGSSSGSSGSSGTTGAPDAGIYTIPELTASVDVSYDSHDVPHIHCAALADCLRAQGYIHAQDRFFEMDLFRRLAEGKLSELLGSATLSQDQFFRTLFITRDGQPVAHALAQSLDANTAAQVQAYADGVNAFLAQARAGKVPVNAEYQDLLIQANTLADWTVEDTLAVGRIQQWELSQTMGDELTFTQTALAASALSEPQTFALLNHIRQLDPTYTVHPTGTPPVPHVHGRVAQPLVQPNLAPALNTLSRTLKEMPHAFSLLGMAGSNNWAIDAAHSATGVAMVANDPHLSMQYPPLFHMSHLIADNEGVDLLGNTFPGIPGILTGRGKHVGWGVTVVGYDVTDLYAETFTDATHVSFNGSPVAVQQYTQTINVRNLSTGAIDPQSFTISVVPHHGPLISMDVAHNTGVSLRWTGHELTREIKALVGLWQAADVNGAFTALADWGTGAQNFMLADDQGHIGFDPHAWVPARPWAGTTVNGRVLLPWLVLPGTGEAEWGYGDGGLWLPDDQLPQSKNPSWGYLVTANSDPLGYTDDDNVLDDPNYLSFGFDDKSGLRVGRITAMLDGFTADGGTVSEANVERIQNDHALHLASYFTPLFDTAWAAAQLTDGGSIDPDGGIGAAVALLDVWQGDGYDCPTGLTTFDPASAVDTDATHARDSAACAYFHTVLRSLVYDVFADDEAAFGTALGNTSFQFDSQQELKAFTYMVDPSHNDQSLCDDRSTTGVTETCNDMVVKALTEARNVLATRQGADPLGWKWGRMHTVSFTSPLGSNAPDFNTTGFARPGGYFTVDVSNIDPIELAASDASSTTFPAGNGPNERFVALMDGSATQMQLPGYQKDVPFDGSAHGLLADWLNGTYFEFPRTSTQITADQQSAVTFRP